MSWRWRAEDSGFICIPGNHFVPQPQVHKEYRYSSRCAGLYASKIDIGRNIELNTDLVGEGSTRIWDRNGPHVTHNRIYQRQGMVRRPTGSGRGLTTQRFEAVRSHKPERLIHGRTDSVRFSHYRNNRAVRLHPPPHRRQMETPRPK